MSTSANAKYIYIIFSAAPYKIGKFIRFITRSPFSHVSISFDPNLRLMYSFSRFYENTPYFGGFVHESPLRYCRVGTPAVIRICRIPVSQDQMACIEKKLKSFIGNQKEYIYNLPSALFVPIKKRIRIKNAYTCIEFVSYLLSSIGIRPLGESYYSIPRLAKAFEPYIIYEGPITSYPAEFSWQDDHFPERKSRRYYIFSVGRNLFQLNRRMVSGLLTKGSSSSSSSGPSSE